MELQGKRAAVLVEQQYQEMEVWYPVYRLREAGCKVTLVGPEAGQTYPSKLGYPAKSDKAARDVSADDFDLLVIPGGYRARLHPPLRGDDPPDQHHGRAGRIVDAWPPCSVYGLDKGRKVRSAPVDRRYVHQRRRQVC